MARVIRTKRHGRAVQSNDPNKHGVDWDTRKLMAMCPHLCTKEAKDEKC